MIENKKKISLNGALRKIRGPHKEERLKDALISGELIAEGRYFHEDLGEEAQNLVSFVPIPRQAWSDYIIVWQESRMFGCFFIGDPNVNFGASIQSSYCEIKILPKHKSLSIGNIGRPRKIDLNRLHAEMCMYFLGKNNKFNSSTDVSKLKEELKQNIPILIEYQNLDGGEFIDRALTEEELKKHFEALDDLGTEDILSDVDICDRTIDRALDDFIKNLIIAKKKFALKTLEMQKNNFN